MIQIFLADEPTAWKEEEEVLADRKSDVICCLNVYEGTRGAFFKARFCSSSVKLILAAEVGFDPHTLQLFWSELKLAALQPCLKCLDPSIRRHPPILVLANLTAVTAPVCTHCVKLPTNVL